MFYFIFITTFDWFLSKSLHLISDKKYLWCSVSVWHIKLFDCVHEVFLCYSNPIVNGTFLPCGNKNGCIQIPTLCKYSCVCIISLKIGLACFLWSIWIFRILKSLLSNLIWWRNLFNPDTPHRPHKLKSCQFHILSALKVQHSRLSPC